jgi:hypothetical protein
MGFNSACKGLIKKDYEDVWGIGGVNPLILILGGKRK